MLPISDQTHLARERARSDAEFYKAHKETEANKVSLNNLENENKSVSC